MNKIINLNNGFVYEKKDFINKKQSEYSIILRYKNEVINALIYTTKQERNNDFNQIAIQLRNQLQDLIFFQ